MTNNIYQKQYLKLIYQWNQKLIYQSRKDNYLLQLKKLNLPQQQLNNLLNLILSFNDTKKELMAVKWLRNGSIILPEDEYKLDKAVQLAERYKLDYQQFSSPMSALYSFANSGYVTRTGNNYIINLTNVMQNFGLDINNKFINQLKNAMKFYKVPVGYNVKFMY